jgi:hypothetical protein
MLSAAIRATFERRRTPVPADASLALTPTFYEDAQKRAQWGGFLRRSRLGAGGESLGEVAQAVRDFVMPPASAARRSEVFDEWWNAGGPWRPSKESEE